MAGIIDPRTGEMIGTSQDKDVINNLNQPKSVKLTDYPSEVCPKCGSKIFTVGYVIKDIPGVEVGMLDKKTVPMPVERFPIFVCAKCGELAPMMDEDDEMKDALKKLLETDKSEDKED